MCINDLKAIWNPVMYTNLQSKCLSKKKAAMGLGLLLVHLSLTFSFQMLSVGGVYAPSPTVFDNGLKKNVKPLKYRWCYILLSLCHREFKIGITVLSKWICLLNILLCFKFILTCQKNVWSTNIFALDVLINHLCSLSNSVWKKSYRHFNVWAALWTSHSPNPGTEVCRVHHRERAEGGGNLPPSRSG